MVERGRAADSEFEANDVAQDARAMFAARENLDDAAPDRLSQNFEDVHAFTMSVRRVVTAN